MSLTDTSREKKNKNRGYIYFAGEVESGTVCLIWEKNNQILGNSDVFSCCCMCFLDQDFSFFKMFNYGTGFLFTGFVFGTPLRILFLKLLICREFIFVW